MGEQAFFLATLLLYLLGAVAAPLQRLGTLRTTNLSFLLSIAASITGVIASLQVLLSGSEIGLKLPLLGVFQHVEPNLSLFASMGLQLDALGAFFLLIISLLMLPVSLYSIGYLRDYSGHGSLALFGALYNLFPLSMIFVIAADNALLFLIAWEGMTLATYFLVALEHQDIDNVRAGSLYLIMAHVGTAFLIALFAIFYQQSGAFDFESFRAVAGQWPDLLKTILFAFALIGFGAKAGIVPLHIWLPQAHPAAPTPISALMSGVMIKMAIYGLLRIYFDFLGPDMEWWWGVVLLAIATITAVLGVFYAVVERDIKRLLAYSSVENIGIILIGISLAMIFYAHPEAAGFGALAGLALIAALYHLANHALFKGLLFMGAGAIMHATHTRNIEHLGGLIKYMPVTAACFLVGAVAISALPPLNGFESEWLTFQSLLLGLKAPEMVVKVALPISTAFLALTGALVAACFVRAFGMIFLAVPRSDRVLSSHEAPRSIQISMIFLAGLCILVGILPMVVVPVLGKIADPLLGTSGIANNILQGVSLISLDPAQGITSPYGIALILLFLIPVAVVILMFHGQLRKRTSMTWGCGLQNLTSRMEYTPTGFSKPLQMIFRNIIEPQREIDVETDVSSYIKRQVRVRFRMESPFERHFYNPLSALLLRTSRTVRKIQSGSINAYLAYIFLALVALLIFAR